MSASTRWSRFAVIVSLAIGCGGCGSIATPQTPPREAASPSSEEEAASDTAPGEFTIAASMNDTWNTVGQVLVRTDGVTYESRAQMLGLYGVRYRGERFLIHTQGVVMRRPSEGMATRVTALELDGKPKHSAAAVELLETLKKRVPEEIATYTLLLIELKAKPKKNRKAKGGG